MRQPQALRVVLALATLVAPAAAWSGARDDKDKEKDKAAKTKPAPRSYSDEDLKKYKDTPKTEPEATQTETQPGSTKPSYGEAPAKRTRAPEPVGNQEAGVEAPSREEPKSAEEADWRARAMGARAPLQEAERRIKGIEAQIGELRDKLNPMSTTYVLGGNSTAGPGAVLEVEEQLRGLDGQLGEARTAAAEAEASWQKFLEEARAAGASPAWLKP